MSNPSKALIDLGPSSQISAAVSSTPAPPIPTPRPPPNVITYSYDSQLVYVTPEDSYENAIDIAKDSYPELLDVDPERISFQVTVTLKNAQVSRMAKIGRTAWPNVMKTLQQFEIVEIRVGPATVHTKTVVAPAPSSFRALTPKPSPSPYAFEEDDGYSDVNTESLRNFSQYRSSMSRSRSISSFASSIIDVLTPNTSRSRPSP